MGGFVLEMLLNLYYMAPILSMSEIKHFTPQDYSPLILCNFSRKT